MFTGDLDSYLFMARSPEEYYRACAFSALGFTVEFYFRLDSYTEWK